MSNLQNKNFNRVVLQAGRSKRNHQNIKNHNRTEVQHDNNKGLKRRISSESDNVQTKRYKKDNVSQGVNHYSSPKNLANQRMVQLRKSLQENIKTKEKFVAEYKSIPSNLSLISPSDEVNKNMDCTALNTTNTLVNSGTSKTNSCSNLYFKRKHFSKPTEFETHVTKIYDLNVTKNNIPKNESHNSGKNVSDEGMEWCPIAENIHKNVSCIF